MLEDLATVCYNLHVNRMHQVKPHHETVRQTTVRSTEKIVKDFNKNNRL